MPHGDPTENVIEAVEKVAHAVEKNTESDPPPSKDKGKIKEKFKPWIHLITSVTALIAAGGAFLKTFDHSLTQNAYNTLAESITKIQDEQRGNHEDLVKLQAYLDGLARNPIMPAPSSTSSSPQTPSATATASAPPTEVDAGLPIPKVVVHTSPPPRPTATSKPVPPMTPAPPAPLEDDDTIATQVGKKPTKPPAVHQVQTLPPPPSFDKVVAKSAW
jgi:hypothetical protein